MEKLRLWRKTEQQYFKNRRMSKRVLAVIMTVAVLFGTAEWSMPMTAYGVEASEVVSVYCDLGNYSNSIYSTADVYTDEYKPYMLNVQYTLSDGTTTEETVPIEWIPQGDFNESFNAPGIYNFEGKETISGQSIGTITLEITQAYLNINTINGTGDAAVKRGDTIYAYGMDSSGTISDTTFTADAYGGYEIGVPYNWFRDNAPYSYIISKNDLYTQNGEINPWETGYGLFVIKENQTGEADYLSSCLSMGMMNGEENNIDVNMISVTPKVTLINDTDIEFNSISVSSPSDTLKYTPELADDGVSMQNKIESVGTEIKDIQCYQSGSSYLARIIPGIQNITDKKGVSGINIKYEYTDSQGKQVSDSISIDDGDKSTAGYLVEGDVTIRLSEVLNLVPKFAFESVSDNIIYDGAAVEEGVDFSMVNPDKDLISYAYARKGTTVYRSGLPVEAGTYIIRAVNRVTNENTETELIIAPKTVTQEMQDSIVLSEQQYYTGTARTPKIKIYDGKTLLTENTDYELSYSNNVNVAVNTAGVAPVINIKGINNYQGILNYKFTILYQSAGRLYLNGETVTGSKTCYINGDLPEFTADAGYTIYYSAQSNMSNASTVMTNTTPYSEGEERSYYIQLKNKKGEWSEPVYIRCIKDTIPPVCEGTVNGSLTYKGLTTRPVVRYCDNLLQLYMSANDATSGIDKVYMLAEQSGKVYTKAALDKLSPENWKEVSANTVWKEILEQEKKQQLYFKVMDRAGNYVYISTDTFVYDRTEPFITDGKGAAIGSSYIADTLDVVVKDGVELVSVTVNGVSMTVTENQAEFQLSVGTHTIVATDRAGNQRNQTIEVIKPIYDVEVADVVMNSKTYGYDSPQPMKLDINRQAGDANIEADISSVTINNDLFVITKQENDYYVSVKEGAAVGRHTGEITVAYNNNGKAKANVTFIVEKRTISSITQMEGSTVTIKDDKRLTYGEKLSSLEFDYSKVVFLDEKGKAVEGTISFANPDKTPSAGAFNAGWIFTPDSNSYNYSGPVVKGTVNVKTSKKTLSVIIRTGQGKTYGKNDSAIKFTIDTKALVGSDSVKITGAPGRSKGEQVGSYDYNKGTLALEKTGAYANYTLAVSASDKYTIKKATPSYTLPTGLKVVYGSHLSDIKLPTGFKFVKSSTTSVGTVGTKKFEVKYTPSDTKNYNIVTGIYVSVTVTKAPQQISAVSSFTKVYQDPAFSLNAKITKGAGTLSYKSSNTSVVQVYSNGRVSIKGMGTAKITVAASSTNNYKYTAKTITITVKPKNVNMVSVKSQSAKKVSVKWVERSGVSGYEIKYSTSKTFSSNSKTSTVTGASRRSKTLEGLQSGKKYYVKVRVYKNVNGKKLYGAWSDVYGVTVK